MHLHDILKSTWFQQTAPLIVLFLIPALAFLFSQLLRRLWYSFSFDLLGLKLEELVFGVYRSVSMGIESLGLSWLWTGSSSSSPSGDGTTGKSGKRHHKRKSSEGSSSSSKSKSLRTRADQIALRNVGKHAKEEEYDYELDEAQHFPGLVNISGTYCFMNSTLQAMASLTYLQPQIEAIQAKAEALDVPTPVIDALRELFTTLNTPKTSYHCVRPQGIIDALSAPPPLPSSSGGSSPNSSVSLYRTSSSLFNSREHQDAQELFQLVSECIKNEMAAVDREGQRDRGIAAVLDLGLPKLGGEGDKLKGAGAGKGEEEWAIAEARGSKSVFDGLTANRRSCVVCGYTEAVMHFGFDNWQLALPRLATSCRLEDCLEDYTRLEILKDCICRNCSIQATHRRLLQELKTLEEALANPSDSLASSSASIMPMPSPSSSPSSALMPSTSSLSSSSSLSPSKPKPSNSKKKRYKEVKKMEARVRTAIAEGRIEDDTLLEGIRLEKVVSPASTKQAMIARPPAVLALHLNRSVHYGQYAAKNTIRVHFPEVLDLTPYTTSGSLSVVPTSSISTPSPPPQSQFQFQIQGPGQGSSSGTSDADPSGQRPRRPTTPTPETYTAEHQRTIYRLAAVVCHYGQHSFGHYICYRRKPRRGPGGKIQWVPPTLVDPLRLEIEEEEGQEEEDKKPNGSAHLHSHPRRTPNYSGSSSLGESRYYWEDHTEEEVGTGRGWLRISDDAVSECGIESVLAEGSGAFMLYYERAVHPRPGIYSYMHSLKTGKSKQGNGNDENTTLARSGSTKPGASRSVLVNGGGGGVNGDVDDTSTVDGDGEGDGFSIGSEETLKPEMRVMDLNLNGSMRSLISEVGVGVLKVSKKEKDKEGAKARKLEKHDSGQSMSMSLHLPASTTSSSGTSPSTLTSSSMPIKFGARIVRSVNARRRAAPEGSPSSTSTATTSSSVSPPSSFSTSASAPTPAPPLPPANGSATYHEEQLGDRDEMDMDEKAWADMTASAPSILSTPTATSNSSTSSADTGLSIPKSTSQQHPSAVGLGSKSTKVMHHHHTHSGAAPAAGVKVKVAQ